MRSVQVWTSIQVRVFFVGEWQLACVICEYLNQLAGGIERPRDGLFKQHGLAGFGVAEVPSQVPLRDWLAPAEECVDEETDEVLVWHGNVQLEIGKSGQSFFLMDAQECGELSIHHDVLSLLLTWVILETDV